MKFSKLAGAIGAKGKILKDFEVKNIACSTDSVIEGSVFFAIKGTVTDGHLYADLAFEKGAAAVVGEENLSPKGTYLRVENSRRGFALAAAEFYGNPQKKLKICAVTGTNGKTTVANMVREIVLAGGGSCGLIGTIENIAGGKILETERTTPDAETFYALLRKMADGGDSVCSMEASSHALAEDRVYATEFDVGIFTNLTRDHLDFHKTMENYAEAKAMLMERSRLSIINADDPRSGFFTARARRAVKYAVNSPADFTAKNIVCTVEGVRFDCPIGEISLPPGGYFSVYNALAAACGALALGISEKQVLKGLNGFRGVKGRLELLPTRGKYRVYIDYAHTPDGLENVLSALKQFAPARIITVFGCGGDRDKTKRPIMGEIASRLSDFCIITDDNPRTEEPKSIITDIIKGISADNYETVLGRKEAIRRALKLAMPDDIVLLAGKGHETYQIAGGERLRMDERELVREIENEEGIQL